MAKAKETENEQLELIVKSDEEQPKDKKDPPETKEEGDGSVQVAAPAKVEGDDEATKTVKALEAKLAKADKERDELRTQNQALEKQRTESNTRAETAEARQIRVQKEQIESNLLTSAAALQTAKEQYKTALEAGNSELATELAEKISDAKYDVRRATEQKGQFENWVAQREEEIKKPKAPQLPPSVQKWINDNPKYTTDPEFRAEADGAHEVAIKRGYTFGSPVYLEFIEGRVKKMTSKEEPTTTVVKTEKEEDLRTPAAPPSRGTSSGDGGSRGDKKFTIPKSVMPKLTEYAAVNNMSPAEYAAALDEDGKLQDFIAGRII